MSEETKYRALLSAERRRSGEMEIRIEDLERALHRIQRWAEAYPLDVFPEPDLKKAHALLQAGGMSIDAISASNMRHVLDGVGAIVKIALEKQS